MTLREQTYLEPYDESNEMNILAGATGIILEHILGPRTKGFITGFGHFYGVAGAFVATAEWSITINGIAPQGWARFIHQRGLVNNPMSTNITVPVGAIVRVIHINGTVGAVDVIARLQMNLETVVGYRMSDQYIDEDDPPVGGGGGGPPPPSPPSGGGGGGGPPRNGNGEDPPLRE